MEGEGKAGLWGHGRGSREPKEWMWRLWRDVSDQCSIVVHFLPCAVLLWLAGRYDFSLTATFLLCASYLAHVSKTGIESVTARFSAAHAIAQRDDARPGQSTASASVISLRAAPPPLCPLCEATVLGVRV